MNCERIENQLTSYLLGDLDEQAAGRVREHLEHCEDCRALACDLEPTLDLLRGALAAPTDVPVSLTEAQRARILSTGPHPEAETRPAARAPRIVLWWGREHPVLALAASLVLTAGFFWLLLGHMVPGLKRTSTSPEVRVVMHSPKQVEELEDLDDVETAMDELEDIPTVEAPVTIRQLALEDEPPDVRWGAAGAGAPFTVEGLSREGDIHGFYSGYRMGLDGAGAPVRYASAGSGEGAMLENELLAHEEFLERMAGDSGAIRWEAEGVPPGAKTTAPLPEPAQPKPESWRRASEDYKVAGLPKAQVTKESAARIVGAEDEHRSDKAKQESETAAPVGNSIPVLGRLFSVAKGAAPAESEAAASVMTAPEEPMSEELPETAESVVVLDAAGPEVEAKFAKMIEVAGEDREDVAADLSYVVAGVSTNALGTRSETSAEVLKKRPDGGESDETGPRFKAVGVNPFVAAQQNPFSTFSIDVDTAAYTLTRRYMVQGVLPPAEAVRTEEFVNFFDYGYAPPVGRTFKVYSEIASSRFGHGLHLLKIGVKGKRLGREEQRQAVLTFLIDTSGSMEKRDRIGLIKYSLRLLVGKLNPQDRIAIVQYGSQTRLILEHTAASDRDKILAALDRLQCSGSTNLEEGMHRAYQVAASNFRPGGENRVLLLSDGAANLGALAASDILSQVEQYRRQGVYCSVFGFGIGAYNDTMLEELADKGNGTYRFIDSEEEARRVFVDDLAATLNTIASDVKIQVEFDPQLVARYRQLGYENRQLRKEDFRNDAVDAGEVGSGQSVTALYELELTSAAFSSHTRRAVPDTLATVRVRYRRTDNGVVEEIQRAVTLSDMPEAFRDASSHFRLAACAAEFAEILRGSPFAAGSTAEDVARELRPVALDLSLDPRVQEFLRMVQSSSGMARAEL